jgi:hypothetical protein
MTLAEFNYYYMIFLVVFLIVEGAYLYWYFKKDKGK